MPDQVQAIRRFNRFYTNYLGLLKEKVYDSPVSLSQARILLEVGYTPGIRARGLMDRLQVDRGQLSRALKKLERMRLLSRTRDQQDRRAYTLCLTEKGDKLLARLEEHSRRQIKDILDDLEPGQRRELAGAMDAIRGILEPPQS